MDWAWAVDPLALLVAAGFIMRSVRKVDKKFGEFKTDWQGEPARPGVPGRPGVMERLSIIELHQVDQGGRLDYVINKMNKKEGSE